MYHFSVLDDSLFDCEYVETKAGSNRFKRHIQEKAPLKKKVGRPKKIESEVRNVAIPVALNQIEKDCIEQQALSMSKEIGVKFLIKNYNNLRKNEKIELPFCCHNGKFVKKKFLFVVRLARFELAHT